MIDATLLPIGDGLRTLRPLSSRDAERYAAGSQDPLVRKYGHLPEPEYTPEAVARLADDVVPRHLRAGDLALLSIVDDAGTFLGSLVLFDVTDSTAEVGFWLHPDSRGLGHSAAALELAAALAVRSGLSEMTARTSTSNSSSRRCLERSGFNRTGIDVGRTPSGEHIELAHYRRHLE
ncbi:GNAT family N-acetyltransferase [Streptomyces sp. NPDC056061]|uniref:GNAT family N-acetyltransferase n=1 Tax=Streptomyces sp. NPDC056061 TaxID=3345700 RepID=UPI0035D58D42